jgi:hypothetical protein
LFEGGNFRGTVQVPISFQEAVKAEEAEEAMAFPQILLAGSLSGSADSTGLWPSVLKYTSCVSKETVASASQVCCEISGMCRSRSTGNMMMMSESCPAKIPNSLDIIGEKLT